MGLRRDDWDLAHDLQNATIEIGFGRPISPARPMKTYLTLTAVLFGLLTVVHFWRMLQERGSLAKDPWFLIITIISAALCFRAVRLLVVARRGPNTS